MLDPDSIDRKRTRIRKRKIIKVEADINASMESISTEGVVGTEENGRKISTVSNGLDTVVEEPEAKRLKPLVAEDHVNSANFDDSAKSETKKDIFSLVQTANAVSDAVRKEIVNDEAGPNEIKASGSAPAPASNMVSGDGSAPVSNPTSGSGIDPMQMLSIVSETVMDKKDDKEFFLGSSDFIEEVGKKLPES